MQGMPDMHCHVLPGIDDGAADCNASIALLNKYEALGFRTIIATPHTMGEIYPNTPSSIKAAHESIVSECPNLKLTYSSEYMLDDTFEKLLEKGELIPLKDKYLLVEMSYFQPPIHIRELLFKITSNGYIPVLAHPERYAFYHGELSIFEEFKMKGCMLQLNALSLSQHYGAKVQKAAFQLLEQGAYDFIGTDTHRLSHLESIATLKIAKKQLPAINILCRNNTLTFS
jgi:protein-tyrosine phosphatase